MADPDLVPGWVEDVLLGFVGRAPESRKERSRRLLEEWAASDLVKAHPKAGPVVAALLGDPDATLREIEALVHRCQRLAVMQESGGRA